MWYIIQSERQVSDMAENNKGINPLAAGLAGAVVGAAAAAGAIILADEKNRAKLEKTIGELKKQGFKVMEVVQSSAQEVKKLGNKKGSVAKKGTAKSK